MIELWEVEWVLIVRKGVVDERHVCMQEGVLTVSCLSVMPPVNVMFRYAFDRFDSVL